MRRTGKSVVDTNVWIELLRRDSATVDFMKRLTRQQRIVCSVISIAELYAGQRDGREHELYWKLRNAEHADVTSEIATQAGAYRRRYGPTHGSELADCLIAATAEAYHADLVTYNIRHFPMPEIRVVSPG